MAMAVAARMKPAVSGGQRHRYRDARNLRKTGALSPTAVQGACRVCPGMLAPSSTPFGVAPAGGDRGADGHGGHGKARGAVGDAAQEDVLHDAADLQKRPGQGCARGLRPDAAAPAVSLAIQLISNSLDWAHILYTGQPVGLYQAPFR